MKIILTEIFLASLFSAYLADRLYSPNTARISIPAVPAQATRRRYRNGYLVGGDDDITWWVHASCSRSPASRRRVPEGYCLSLHSSPLSAWQQPPSSPPGTLFTPLPLSLPWISAGVCFITAGPLRAVTHTTPLNNPSAREGERERKRESKREFLELSRSHPGR